MVGLITLGDFVFDVDPATGATLSVDPDQFEGWTGDPASTLRIAQRPRNDGGWAGDGFRTPRHISWGGIIDAPSEAALEDVCDRLEAAVTLGDTVLSVQEATRTRHAVVRREDDVIIKHLTPTAAAYSVQVVAPDPRRLGDELDDSTGLAAASGGLVVPHTIPYTINSTVISGTVSLFNPGTKAGPARLRIEQATGPVVTHVGSGRSLVFASSVVLTPGEWIDVDMERQEVLANGQASRNGYVTQRGWSRFEPGWNTWAFTAASYSAAAKLTVYAKPAW